MALEARRSRTRDELASARTYNQIVADPEKVDQEQATSIAAQNAGADIISAINTVKATGIRLNFNRGKFHQEFINGGLSGSVIKPVALRAISTIKTAVNIPIIGMGGISSLNDIFEFIAAGADAFQIGTANFTHPTIAEDITSQLEEFINNNGFSSFEDLKNKIREDIKNE